MILWWCGLRRFGCVLERDGDGDGDGAGRLDVSQAVV